jgi:hypothetical protein
VEHSVDLVVMEYRAWQRVEQWPAVERGHAVAAAAEQDGKGLTYGADDGDVENLGIGHDAFLAAGARVPLAAGGAGCHRVCSCGGVLGLARGGVRRFGVVDELGRHRPSRGWFSSISTSSVSEIDHRATGCGFT